MKKFIFHIVITLIILFLDENQVRDYIGYFFLLQYAIFVFDINKKNTNKKLTPYLEPSFLMITYISIYFGLGSIYLNNKLGLMQRMVDIYHNVDNFTVSNLFFLLCIYIAYLVSSYVSNRYTFSEKKESPLAIEISRSAVIISAAIFVLFSVISFDLSELGGSGDFSYIPKLVTSIFMLLYIASKKFKFRYIYYLLLLLIFASVSYESKREIIFVLILIVFIENLFNPINFNISFRTLLTGVLGVSVFTFFILVSSVNRGYGNYDPEGIVDSIKYIPDYIESDFFLDAIGDNFELNFVYGNALNATDMYFSGEQELLYGETFYKVFFVFIPKSIFDYKPRSMIQIYSPQINEGGVASYPVVVFTEFLWNFGVLFFVGLIVLVYAISTYYYKFKHRIMIQELTVKDILTLVFYTIFMQFVRGSGLDLLFVYGLISIPFIYILIFFNKNL